MEPNTQPISTTSEATPQEGPVVYHTVSGGPETLHELQMGKKKEVGDTNSGITPMPPVQQGGGSMIMQRTALGGPMYYKNSLIEEEENSSSAPFLLVLFILLLLAGGLFFYIYTNSCYSCHWSDIKIPFTFDCCH